MKTLVFQRIRHLMLRYRLVWSWIKTHWLLRVLSITRHNRRSCWHSCAIGWDRPKTSGSCSQCSPRRALQPALKKKASSNKKRRFSTVRMALVFSHSTRKCSPTSSPATPLVWFSSTVRLSTWSPQRSEVHLCRSHGRCSSSMRHLQRTFSRFANVFTFIGSNGSTTRRRNCTSYCWRSCVVLRPLNNCVEARSSAS